MARLCSPSPLQNLTASTLSPTPSCRARPWYLSIEHHRRPVVLLFLQDKDNVSWQDLQLLSGLGDELVQDAVRLPFKGPGCGSGGQVRKVGDIFVLLRRENPDLCLLASVIPSPSRLSFGCWLDAQLQWCRMGLDLLYGLAALSILHPTYLRISGFLGLGGGPEACQREDKKKIISNLE